LFHELSITQGPYHEHFPSAIALITYIYITNYVLDLIVL
jgi:hypothetical protein